jgi:2-polyprenyl-3-methyl-5-hydroxy-6-metoxy-1,4-benzoquinol methylase
MTFKPDHWTNPRKTIATKFEKDDLGYATHGAMVAMEVIRRLDLKPSEAGKLKLLDYGCGTGRIARVLSGFFGQVTGYDPVVQCIHTGLDEQRGMAFPNLIMTSMFEALEGEKFDVIVSTNVMEHLDMADQQVMMDRISSLAKPGARLLLWYSIRQNLKTLASRFGEHIVADDLAFLAAKPGSGIQVREFRL